VGSGGAAGGDEAGGFAGDHQLFVGRNHQYTGTGIVGREIGLGRGGGVARRIEDEAEVRESVADLGTQPGIVFANAGGKDERIAAAELDPK